MAADPAAGAVGRAGADAAPDRQIVHVLNRLAFGPTLDGFPSCRRRSGSSATSPSSSTPRRSPSRSSCEWAWRSSTRSGSTRCSCARFYGPLRPALGLKPSPEAVKAQSERAAGHRARGGRGARAARGPEPAPAAGGDGRFLVQPFQRLRRQGAGPSVDRQLRGAGDPSLRARPLSRPAVRHRQAPGDAGLSRQHDEHRAGQPRRARRASAGSTRISRAR